MVHTSILLKLKLLLRTLQNVFFIVCIILKQTIFLKHLYDNSNKNSNLKKEEKKKFLKN